VGNDFLWCLISHCSMKCGVPPQRISFMQFCMLMVSHEDFIPGNIDIYIYMVGM
jgi:hypothetical protein